MKKNILGIAVIFFFWVLMSATQAATLEIPGTGAAEILLNKLAQAFNRANPEEKVVVPPSVGSSGGIRLVGEEKNILGRVARPLEEKEKQYSLTYLAFAKDPVLFAVNAEVGITNLSASQLISIFSGRMHNWQEVGGRDSPIHLLVREPDDSSFLIIKQHMPAFRDIHFPGGAKYLYHDSEMVEMLQKYSTVIGWLTGSSLNSISTKVTGLTLDGVEPSAANIRSGRYPLSEEYALVFKKKRLTPLARKFMEFLSSEEAVRIMTEEGVIPITNS